jgi:hypothetical protein
MFDILCFRHWSVTPMRRLRAKEAEPIGKKRTFSTFPRKKWSTRRGSIIFLKQILSVDIFLTFVSLKYINTLYVTIRIKLKRATLQCVKSYTLTRFEPTINCTVGGDDNQARVWPPTSTIVTICMFWSEFGRYLFLSATLCSKRWPEFTEASLVHFYVV